MNLVRTYRNYGLLYIIHRAYQLALHLPIRGIRTFTEFVAGKRGLEIGGPSGVFDRRGLIPIYDVVGLLDNCNFASQTLWAKHSSGTTFQYSSARPAGYQYVAEGSDLLEIPDATYDFILSSHMLEHTANPLRALQAWNRVLKPNGALIVLVPDRQWTFDHKRPVTAMSHLVEDLERAMPEDDLTHMAEVLHLHDLRRDPGVDSFDTLKARCETNIETRGMHHHVFDRCLLKEALEYANFSVRFTRNAFAAHIIAVANKID